ncbi:tetratricopeptide repeat protein [Nitrospirillum sp. BR 11828]|uniref:tetratricopeptide repeat protein n=1 Tax=Nitrospirillum sp. BR 11828 TaxID=3104325 RepID=UPI002ACA54CD|nr:tetratricopeptide repeat protein [Nitrospirillum sp. BR 11828]MDZ5649334.1 tetratricopeptide repeat protein [Nitrospirillum sp. BR 11828]
MTDHTDSTPATPEDAAVLILQADGLAALEGGDAAHAVSLLSQAVALRPDDAALRADLGLAYERQQDNESAKAAYGMAVALDPDSPIHRFNLGAACQRLGQGHEAATHYLDALEREPMLAEAYFNLATLFQDAGHLDIAEQHYRNALEARPSYVEAAANLGLVLRRLGRLDEALDYLRATAEAQPDLAQTHSNLGLVLNEAGQYQEALAVFDRLAALRPFEVAPQVGRAAALRGLGHLAEAATAIRQALSRPETTVSAELEAAQIAAALQAAGNGAAARSLVDAWRATGVTPILRHTEAALGLAPPPPRAELAYLEQMYDAQAAMLTEQTVAGATAALSPTLAATLARHLGPAAGTLQVLEIDCGVGALAPLLKPYAADLVGVHPSATAVQAAARSGLYDQLVHGDHAVVLERSTANANLIVSTDIANHIGDLGPLASAAADALLPGGTLVLVLDAAEPWAPALTLKENGRYLHRRDHVEGALRQAGLTVLEGTTLPPAAPGGVERLLVVARKG